MSLNNNTLKNIIHVCVYIYIYIYIYINKTHQGQFDTIINLLQYNQTEM